MQEQEQDQAAFFLGAGHMARARYGVGLPPKGHIPAFIDRIWVLDIVRSYLECLRQMQWVV